MIDLLQKLIQRYQAELETTRNSSTTTHSPPDTSGIKDTLSSLLFAESTLYKIALCENYPQHPKQIVVIGPTQVGKSSIVNLLLGSELAEASAMAGFTVHCQGYSVGNPDNDGWAKAFFEGIQSQAQSALDRQVLNEYSLTNADRLLPDSAGWQGCVVWDTPDFDSVESYGYRLPVLRAAALADLIVFTVSREKYADKTVWTMLSQLAELSKPVILVINKTPEQYRGELADSVRQKYERVMAGKAVSDLPLHFIDEYKEGPAAAGDSVELAELRSAISSQLHRPPLETLQLQSKDFMAVHWSRWTAPLVEEHQRQTEWKHLVDRMSEALVARYRSEYLGGARNKEIFQLALAELLALLEVPGVAEPLSRLRSVVTWPVRKLIGTATDSARQSDVPKDDRGEERRLLEELAEHGLSQLAVQISERENSNVWWSEIDARLGSRKQDLLQGFEKGLNNYQVLLQVEIERAAQSLYKKLQQQPVTLNGLRAARVTTDAAAVVLAVKSGGLGAADLVLAPAMLSLTSMLTEGALGQYMQKVQNNLSDYQKKEVASLISRKLRVRLYPLATEVVVCGKISTAKLQEAAEQLGLSMPEINRDQHRSNAINTGEQHV